ncbi:hypothetical protein LDENG_00247850 [Lucifuga dentata]|nr:hypothetical protein LDENG_00247850 [Lucifuga dentata]
MWSGCIYAAVQDMKIIESALLWQLRFSTGHGGGYHGVHANSTQAALILMSWTDSMRDSPSHVQAVSPNHHVMMDSSLALGRLELTPNPGAGGVSLAPRLSGSPKEKSGQRPAGQQAPAHLNGCVPLSHQVAGHKYGVDKVGR